AVRERLADLGITDQFRTRASRSLLDVVTARSEYQDRAWYAEADHELHIVPAPEEDQLLPRWETAPDNRMTLELMKLVEKDFGRKNLIVETDYARGAVTGRSQALDWLFGEEWPELEPTDGWDAEVAEEDRADGRQYLAIDGLDRLLFGDEDDD